MKVLNKILPIFVASLVGFSSCGDEFTNVTPTSLVTSDQISDLANNNPDKLLLVIDPLLLGTYNYLNISNTQNSSGTQHGDFGLMSIFHMGDVMNDDLAFHVQGSGWFTYDYMFDYRAEQYSRTFQYWNFFYTIINRSNDILDKVPASATLPALKAAKGQALALRSMAYYYLINMYQQTYSSLPDPAKAPGIPLILAKEEGESKFNRVSVKEVYSQIEKDFLTSISLLDGYARPSKTFINKQVAQVLLSRVYLVMEKWADAAALAHDARTNSTATLMSKAEAGADGYNSINNKEWMWGADIIPETTTKFASFFSFVGTFDAGYGGSVGQYRKIDAKLYSELSSTDVRLALFKSPKAAIDPKSTDVAQKCPAYTNFKFKKVTGWEADYVFMRVSETYLTEAEALAHLGKNTEAATLMNSYMANRDPSWNKSTVTVDEVYTQRRLELWGEGFSFFDHLRLKKNIVRDYPGTNHWTGGIENVAAGDWKLLFQLPRREMQENKSLTPADQNP